MTTPHCKYAYIHVATLRMAIICWLILSFFLRISALIAGEKTPPLKDIHPVNSTVVIVRSQEITAYNEAVRGFEEGCKGENIVVSAIYDLKGDTGKGRKIAQNIRGLKTRPDLILAVGVLAATMLKNEFSDIPIIFCMVINHERFNLQAANVSGISSEASLEDQFSVLKELLGAHKNIGVIYDPAKTGRIVSEALKVSESYEFNLIAKEVALESEVVPAFKNIVGKIGILWLIPDGTVITKDSLEGILKLTQKHHMPTFCTSSAIVRTGALVSVSPDYIHTGLQAAQMAKTLLGSPTVTSVGIKQPEKLKITVNTQTAKTLGVNLSPLQSRSDVVLYP